MFDTSTYERCSDEELELGLGMDQLHALEAAVRHERLKMAAVYARREAFRRDGARCMGEWMAARHGISKRAAREQVRVAEALERLPEVAARAADGRVSWEKLAAVTKVADGATDLEWARRAEELSVAGVLGEVARAKPPTAEQDARAHNRRYARILCEDGGYRLFARLDAVDGAAVERALMLGAERIPPDPETGLPLPYEVRCADALVAMARGRLAAETDPDRATIVVHVDGELLTGGRGAAEIAGGPVISSETLERLGCNARWQYVAEGPNGPIGVGRVSRIVPPGLARQVLRSYGYRCAFPGCGCRVFLECHHLKSWRQGGPTDFDNLAPFCWWHHAVLHRGWRVIRQLNGTLRFYRPDGSELRTTPAGLDTEVRDRFFGRNDDGDARKPGDRHPLE